MQPIYISKRNSTYQILHALKTNRTKRKRLQEVFVEGIAAIKSSVQAGKTLKRLIYRDGGRLSNWANNIVASNRDAQLIAIDEKLFNELCDKNNPAELLATIANEEIKFNQIKLQDNPFITVIDRPSNHGNLGSIIRSAHAFGVDLLVTVGHAVDMYDPAVIRASMGSIFLTKIFHEESVKGLKNRIDNIRRECPGITVIGTDSKAKMSLPEVHGIRRPVILLIGNEARGLSVQLKAMADKMFKIPMIGSIDFLNVARTATIMMYTIFIGSGKDEHLDKESR